MNTSHSALLVALLAGSAALAQGQTLLYEFTFDDYANGTATVSTGQPSRTANLIHHPSSGVTNPTNLRGAPGSGVSGSLGDYALDINASQMGGSSNSAGYGGAASLSNATSVLSGVTSLTIAGWYNANSKPGTYARLIELGETSLYFQLTGSTYVLQATAGRVGSSGADLNASRFTSTNNAIFSVTSEWVFFAFTFDGTTGTGNLYAGTSPETLVSIGTRTDLAQGAIFLNANAATTLSIGNSASSAYERPFDGLIDNIRIWADTSGSASALSEEALKNVMRNDLGLIPEPSSAAVLAGVATLGLAATRRRRAK
mgnify:CR=1 FL=1|jgi:PEP-CTERM putative exosortase interaction domain